MEDIVVLDTCVLLDFLGGKEGADETQRLLEAGRGAVSAVSAYELFRGVGSRRHREQRRSLLSYLHVIDLDSRTALEAGVLYTQLRKGGVTICNEDILIAACCVRHGMPIFTRNVKHFENIPGLRLHTVE